jgi:hypothetical protein
MRELQQSQWQDRVGSSCSFITFRKFPGREGVRVTGAIWLRQHADTLQNRLFTRELAPELFLFDYKNQLNAGFKEFLKINDLGQHRAK